MAFLSPLDTRVHLPGEFVLLDHFGFECELAGHGRFQLWTLLGFITDFASIPWAVQGLPGFDVNGPSRFAAIPHDWLYCHRGRVEVVPRNTLTGQLLPPVVKQFSRGECDEIFRLAILAIGDDPFTRYITPRRYSQAQAGLFWAGVRAGGWYYWNKRRKGIDPDYDFVQAGYLDRAWAGEL